ncbi:MAG: hypothetical protein ACJAZ5_002676 [Alloalcanivorax venustensis]|jgi:hypothetical protein
MHRYLSKLLGCLRLALKRSAMSWDMLKIQSI